MKRLLGNRKRKALVTGLVCGVTGVAALTLATILQDATGQGSGKLGSLGNVTVTAGPVPDQTLLPGQTAPASVHLNNPNQQSQYIVNVTDATGDFLDHTTGQPLPETIRLKLSVNTHPMLNGSAIEVPPGGRDVLIPATFALTADAPLAEYQNTAFRKQIQLRLASTPNG